MSGVGVYWCVWQWADGSRMQLIRWPAAYVGRAWRDAVIPTWWLAL